MIRSMPGRGIHLLAVVGILLPLPICQGAVKLNALGAYLTKQGYGGAQLVDSGKFYHLPILFNGKPGNLVVDTGAPTTLVFRSSVKRLGLKETKTDAPVRGAFGQGRERYSTAMIDAFVAGNFRITNVPVAIAPDLGNINAYGRPNGLFGLRELVKFGAILDFSQRMVYLHPHRPNYEVSTAVRSMLEGSGWKAVGLTFTRGHLRVPGEVNDQPCYFLVDSGSFLTTLDRHFAAAARIPTVPTRATAHGVGRSTPVGLATFSSLWVGNYQIKRASASVAEMDPTMLGRGTSTEVAGLLGVEYLALNSAIFDFVSGTIYLRPRQKL